MRPMRSALAVAGVILALGVCAPSVSATSSPHAIHMIKDCSEFNAVAPTYCTIKTSDLAAIPPGTKVWYTGPVVANSYFLSSNVTLDDENGSTSTGYCIFETKPTVAASVGLCTFWAGTGSLAGFTAVLDVTIDEAGAWHWDGTYYFSDEVKGPTEPINGSAIVLISQDGRPR